MWFTLIRKTLQSIDITSSNISLQHIRMPLSYLNCSIKLWFDTNEIFQQFWACSVIRFWLPKTQHLSGEVLVNKQWMTSSHNSLVGDSKMGVLFLKMNVSYHITKYNNKYVRAVLLSYSSANQNTSWWRHEQNTWAIYNYTDDVPKFKQRSWAIQSIFFLWVIFFVSKRWMTFSEKLLNEKKLIIYGTSHRNSKKYLICDFTYMKRLYFTILLPESNHCIFLF